MSVLIKGGRIVTAADDYVGDVYVENERISLCTLLPGAPVSKQATTVA